MFGIFGSGVRVLGLWVLGLGKRCDAGMVVGLFSFGLSLTGSGLALGGFRVPENQGFNPEPERLRT